MTKLYRTAIVGTGAIADAHARAVHAVPERARVVAAVDVDVPRAKEFARTWDVPETYGSVTELLVDGDVDLVHVCTPPRSHLPIALECLAAGVTVLVEKPPVVSLSEMDMLLATERRSAGRVAAVFQHRFGSAAVRLRRLAADGVLGRPLVATCHTLWYRDDEYFAAPWRGSWAHEGGGPTMGHGIHQFDLLLSVLGRWEQVTALAVRQSRPTRERSGGAAAGLTEERAQERGTSGEPATREGGGPRRSAATHRTETEDVSMAMVTFTNGAVASVVNSLVSPRETSTLRFDYEHATVEVEHLYGYRDTDWTVTPAPGHPDVWLSGVDTPSGHEAQLVAVFDALDRGEPPPVTLADARDTMEFIAALYESAFTGRPVRRGEVSAAFAERMDGTGAPWRPLT